MECCRQLNAENQRDMTFQVIFFVRLQSADRKSISVSDHRKHKPISVYELGIDEWHARLWFALLRGFQLV